MARLLGEDYTEEQLENMIKKADLDQDGALTSDDFYNMITGKVYWD